MKVQCPQCREIVEMEDFSTSEAGLRFTCGNCNQTSFLENLRKGESGEEPAGPAQPAVPDEVTCPKCGHSQRDPYACHRCGLVFSKFDQSKLPPDPEEAAALWKEIRLLPADDSRHQAFLEACLKADRLDYAARQYRLMLNDPAGKATAEKMLERLFAKAQAQLAPVSLAAEGRQGENRQKSKILVWIIVAAFAGLMIYYLISMTDMLSKMSP